MGVYAVHQKQLEKVLKLALWVKAEEIPAYAVEIADASLELLRHYVRVLKPSLNGTVREYRVCAAHVIGNINHVSCPT